MSMTFGSKSEINKIFKTTCRQIKSIMMIKDMLRQVKQIYGRFNIQIYIEKYSVMLMTFRSK